MQVTGSFSKPLFNPRHLCGPAKVRESSFCLDSTKRTVLEIHLYNSVSFYGAWRNSSGLTALEMKLMALSEPLSPIFFYAQDTGLFQRAISLILP